MSNIHNISELDRKLKIGIVLNTGFTIFEFIVGIFSGSLALISDAGHNLTDALSLIISFFAQKIAKREANAEHSYGYGRATIIAALLNGLILVGLSLYIFSEAIVRLQHPEPVQGLYVAVVAAFGIIVNTSIALLFRKNQDDLNMKSAFINMKYDAIASAGALLAGVIIVFTNFTMIDPLISIMIGIFLVRSSYGVIRDGLHVLLEGVPEGIKSEKIKATILNTTKIKNVDDLHIWAISSHYAALSCHIVIEDCELEESMQIVKKLKEELREKFHIHHATIETELVPCDPKDEK